MELRTCLRALSLVRPLVRVLCLPDIERAIGGVKQLYRHVEHLQSLGWDAAIITEAPGFRPAWFSSTASTISIDQSEYLGELNPERCVLLVPETYIGVDFSNFRSMNLSHIPKVIFNQNAYYTFGDFPSNTTQLLKEFYDDQSVLHILSVSEDTHNFLLQNISIPDSKLSRIVNAVESIFRPDQVKQSRIHWMPRKNPDHVQAVISGLKRSSLRYGADWQGEPIIDLSHLEVSQRLNGAKLFLSFGHPEGFGLPIAEAMAAGCWVVGYSGGGGNELFRFGASSNINFGDWSGFQLAIQKALECFSQQPRVTEMLIQRQSLAVRTLYSLEQERSSILSAWERITDIFNQIKSTR